MDKMTKKPLQKRSQERMQKALDSAYILLISKPLEEISIPEIAKHSGVPRSSIYQYFPTMTLLLNELAYQQMLQLLMLLQSQTEHYLKLSLFEILKDLIIKTSDFYNHNRVASLLILKGSISTESYAAQQEIIDNLSHNIINILQNSKYTSDLKPNQEIIEHLIEVTFSLMKHSYFKEGSITTKIQQDIFDICTLYLKHKGY